MILILLVLFMPFMVNAEVFYTDMYESDNANYTVVEERELYNNYKYVKKDMGYYQTKTYDYVDENDYKTNYKYYISPLDKDNEQNIYYKMLDKRNISELRTYWFATSNNVLIKYKVYYLDKVIYEDDYHKSINDEGKIINLLKEYDLKDIKIDIYLDNIDLTSFAFYLVLYDSSKSLTACDNYNISLKRYPADTDTLIHLYFLEEKEYDDLLNSLSFVWDKSIYEKSITLFKKEYKEYLNYNLEKEYLNEYTIDAKEGYILDKENYIIDKKYYNNCYINVNDEFNENNIIVDTSCDPDDIDYKYTLDNNIYKLEIKVKDNVFYKEYVIENNDIISDTPKEEVSNIQDITNESYEETTTLQTSVITTKKTTSAKAKKIYPQTSSATTSVAALEEKVSEVVNTSTYPIISTSTSKKTTTAIIEPDDDNKIMYGYVLGGLFISIFIVKHFKNKSVV